MMEAGGTHTGSHPSLQALALYSNRDLKRFPAWRVQRHLRHCSRCRAEVQAFRSATEELRRAQRAALAAFESHTDWNRLEREMTGNIAVGVAAARCVDKIGRKRMLLSRGALVAFGLAALFVAGWMTHIPKAQNQHLLSSLERLFETNETRRPVGTVVETTPQGIAVRTDSATLTILHPPSAVISLAGGSGVAATYVDEETGQVTIAKVYGQ